MAKWNAPRELKNWYIHYCDNCPKAHDSTCSGADFIRCMEFKTEILKYYVHTLTYWQDDEEGETNEVSS